MCAFLWALRIFLACNFIKIFTSAQVISCEFYKIKKDLSFIVYIIENKRISKIIAS